jgi:predicted PurR-regulated permease PerM
MLGVSKPVVRAAWTLLLLVSALALLWLLRELWFVLIVALLFSYLLAPVVNFVDRTLPREWKKKHPLAGEAPLLLVYLLLLGAVAGVSVWIAGQVLSQAASLTEKLPELLRNREALVRWPLPPWLEPMRAQAIEWAQGLLEGGFNSLLPYLKTISGQLLSGLGSASLALLVPVFSFYFLKDGQTMAQAVVNRFPYALRRTVGEIFGDLHRLLSVYMRALILLSLATFVVYELFFLMTGVPYSTLLSVLAAVLEFVPVVGPLTASAVVILVAAFSGYTGLVWLLVFLLGYRLFQDYVLQPLLFSQGIELHPMLVLVAVLGGERLAGIPGMILAIPLVAAVRIVYLKLEAGREAAS